MSDKTYSEKEVVSILSRAARLHADSADIETEKITISEIKTALSLSWTDVQRSCIRAQ